MKLLAQYKGLKKENYILFFGKIVTNLGAMVWPMLTMILHKKLGLSATDTATFIIVSGVIFLPANLWGGHIADHFNKKKVIIGCDMISILLFIISGFLPLSLFSMCVLLVGAFFQTLEAPAYQALVAKITPPDKREKAFSLLYLGGNIGLIASPVLAGLLFHRYLWLCFVISGLSISVSTILIARFIRETDGEKENLSHKDAAVSGGSILKIFLRSRALPLFVLAHTFYHGAYSQFGYLMPLDISRAFPENGAFLYGTINSVNCLVVVLCTPLLTMLFEKVSMTTKFATGILLQAISFLAFLLSFGFIPGYYFSIVLFTLGEIMTSIMIGAYLSLRVPEQYRGRIFGLNSFAASFMSGVVEWTSGYLFDHLGLSYAWGFSIGMTMVAVVASLILIREDRIEFAEQGI